MTVTEKESTDDLPLCQSALQKSRYNMMIRCHGGKLHPIRRYLDLSPCLTYRTHCHSHVYTTKQTYDKCRQWIM
jgi:hypothetical protein